MKTKEIIERLQELDPAGELECCVDNQSIFSIHVEPAYWDGCLETIQRDSSKRGYNVIGCKIVSGGEKVSFDVHSIQDAIFHNDEVPVEFDGDHTEMKYKDWVEEQRRVSRQVSHSVDLDSFCRYIKKKAAELNHTLSEDEVYVAAQWFYVQNLYFKDKLDDDIVHANFTGNDGKTCYYSWNERKEMQWDRDLKITIEDNKLCIKKS